MTAPQPDDNAQKPYDEIIDLIVDYAYDYEIVSEAAWARSKLALIDSLGVAIESLVKSKECAALVKPSLPGAGFIAYGFKLPGTGYSMDMLQGAFSMGAMIRYLDHNDAFPGAEWGHPSDNLGAILVTADVITRDALARGSHSEVITMKQVLTALIKTYEIQGVFQIKNAFNKVGLDHTILVKIASTALISWLMGLSREQARAAVSHAWVDGHPLRIFRQAPNAGPRKGWAAGDACMRAVHLANLARAGQPGIRTPLTAERWGFYHVLNKGSEFNLPPRGFGSWVAENVIFKVLTAEGHGLTAVEATMAAARELREKTDHASIKGIEGGYDPVRDIESIRVRTQEAAMIIINKRGPLHNAADRDHCLRYMMAVVLLKGGAEVETEDYQDDSPWATDARVEALRGVISMEEDVQFTRDYHDPEVRSCGSSIEILLKDGTVISTRQDFPLGHMVRNEETVPLVRQKAVRNLELRFPKGDVEHIMRVVEGPEFEDLPASNFMDLFERR
ncbi:2-methylcitrate dehydratase [Bombardia bombarda]|uniref:2-methylcitrate dehydratase n=1 Tax=Bombardia bombarda TaxID=252184 RepID=A0AA40C933_9PEZI|nr:2-methylcitrate dehydratase [Bombardia bombarda]